MHPISSFHEEALDWFGVQLPMYHLQKHHFPHCHQLIRAMVPRRRYQVPHLPIYNRMMIDVDRFFLIIRVVIIWRSCWFDCRCFIFIGIPLSIRFPKEDHVTSKDDTSGLWVIYSIGALSMISSISKPDTPRSANFDIIFSRFETIHISPNFFVDPIGIGLFTPFPKNFWCEVNVSPSFTNSLSNIVAVLAASAQSLLRNGCFILEPTNIALTLP
eukprot:scaffold3721_cov118-Alexandrium_tamarense.AAC.1